MRIAIAGCGPKGLYALERLSATAAAGGRACSVDVFEPHPVPGAGPTYDPSSPGYLITNFSAGNIDAWPPGERIPGRPSFVEWSRSSERPYHPDDFPPRAVVGRYLADCLAGVLRAVPPRMRVRIRPVAVTAVSRAAPGWEVATAGSAEVYDQVLIATGHRPARRAGRVLPVFPVERHLAEREVPPGARVAIRGFALTFIDAALALTEGRGGTFARSGDGTLRYAPSGREPAVILPHSRTGRPLLAKPAGALAARPWAAAEADRASAALLSLSPEVDVRHDVVPLVSRIAQAALREAGRDARARAEARRWLEAACAARPWSWGGDAADELADSVAVATGRKEPGPGWALGLGWRLLYPALVARLSHIALDPDGRRVLGRLGAEMERVAFGPPVVNAEKLLALIAAGIVDLTFVAGGSVRAVEGRRTIVSAAGSATVDVCVDAVLPAPGVGADDRLMGRLLADGHVRRSPGNRGIDVAPDGTCIARSGAESPGLACIGRPTEDCVIGNDTLSRTLHPHAARWARRVLAPAVAPAASPRLLVTVGEQ